MRSAFAVLSALPAVFDYRDVAVALNLNSRAAIQQCYRWKSNRFIKSTGIRTGVFYNLIVDRNHSDHLMEALAKSIRQPMIIVGGKSIQGGGWTTQIPQTYEVAVPATRSSKPYPKIDGVRILPRPPSWFRTVWNVSQDHAQSSIRLAPPEYGLVDSIRSRHVYDRKATHPWFPPASDIQPPEDPVEVIEKCYRAAISLDFDPRIVRDYLSETPDVEDDIDLVDIDEIRFRIHAEREQPHLENDNPLDALAAHIQANDIPCLVIGRTAMQWGDYTTIQGTPTEIAVAPDDVSRMPPTEGVVFVERSEEWIDAVRSKADMDGWWHMPTASGAHALVDIIARSNGRLLLSTEDISFTPAEVCLYVDDDLQVIRDCYSAANDLGVPVELVQEYLGHVQELLHYVERNDVPIAEYQDHRDPAP